MGCWASTAVARPQARAPPQSKLKPLEEWNQNEVEHWFSGIPRVAKYHSLLLPDDGCVVAVWNEQFLVRKGVPEDDATRIISYRDKEFRSARPSLSAKKESQAPRAVVPSSSSYPTSPPRAITLNASSRGTFTQSPTSGTAAPFYYMATPNTEQKSEDTADSEKSRRQDSLVTLAKKGLTFVRSALEKLGPSLPFPGAQAANMLLQVLIIVDTAMVTSDNVLALRDRALAVMDILDAYREQLKGLQHYKEVVGRYMDLLQGILPFAQAYASRNLFLRLITGDRDAAHYEALQSEMVATGRALMALVTVDSNARIQGMEATVSKSRALLEEMVQYRDPLAEARSMVEKFGGIEAVLLDSCRLGEVMQKLDISTRVTVHAVTSVLQGHLDKGPHRHIKQPELRLLWAKHFGGEAEVPWFAFWEVFPELMRDLPSADVDVIEALCKLFMVAAAKAAFQRAVGRTSKDNISVWELCVSFNGDDGLMQQVQRLLGDREVQAGLSVAGNPATNSIGVPAAGGLPTPKIGFMEANSQLPPLPAIYLGRDKDAAAVLDQLKSNSSLVLLAPGGMGKSCLAADVGWRLLRQGGAVGRVLWVDLREAISAAEMEARFCATLGLEPDETDNSSRIVAALCQQTTSILATGHVPLLVVVDNAEDAMIEQGTAAAFRRLLGKVLAGVSSARLLITSRVSLGSDDDFSLPERHVGEIAHDAAVQLVLGCAADLTGTQAEEVVHACRYVPLLLCLVAESLAMGRLALQDISKLQGRGGDDNSSSSEGIIHVVLASLRRPHQFAVAQLAVFPTTIQEELAAEVLGISEPETRAICAVLCNYSVLQRAGPRRYVMHDMVRQMAAELGRQLDADLRKQVEKCFVRSFLRLLNEWGVMYRTGAEWQMALAAARDHMADITYACDLLSAVGDDMALDVQLTNDVVKLLSAAGLLGRFRSPCNDLLARMESTSKSAVQMEVVATLQWMLSYLLLEGGHYTNAAALAQRCVTLRTELLGAKHPDTLASLSHLANCKKACGQYAEAEPIYLEVLKARQQKLGAEHLDTLASLNNLAACIGASGRNAEAQPMYQEVLKGMTQVLGAEHPDTLTSLSNFAACIRACGRYAEAEPMYSNVLEARRRLLGAEHPDTLRSYNNLATCIKACGRNAEAESMYLKVLEARRWVLGAEHPDTLSSLSNLAACIKACGRYAAAEPIYMEVFAARQRVLGAEHPDTLASLSNLAACIKSCGRYAEAEATYLELLKATRRVLGTEHPDSLACLNNLAACIGACGRYADAEPMYLEVLEARRRLMGSEHPETLASLNNVATCIRYCGRNTEAEMVYLEVLTARRRILGDEHPDTLSVLNNLAVCIGACGRYAEAEKMYREVLEARKRVLGAEHPDTLTSLNNLAGCIRACGHHSEAERMYREVLEARRRVLGVEHPSTLSVLNAIATCIRSRGSYAEAEPIYREVLEARRRVLGSEHPETLASINNLIVCIRASCELA